MPHYQNYPYSSPYAPTNYMQRAYAPQAPQMAQPQAQPQPQMQMPMAQQMPPMDMPIQDIKYVNRAQAEAYIVFPNTKVMLIDKESGLVYVKTADGMGQTQTDYFRFDRVNADGTPIKAQEPTPQVDFNEFVKIDEFKALQAKFEQLIKRLEVKPNVGQPKQPEARV